MNLELLNPQQQDAVTTTEGPLLILAGAGSGKTKVLTNRVAYLIYEKNVSPFSILAITFTNKAAAEMRERITDLIGVQGERVWASTFHSTCVRILRQEITYLGYDTNFVIYDDADQQALIKIILREMNLDEKKYPPKTVSAKISACKNELQTPRDMQRAAFGNEHEEKYAEIYRLYQERLLKDNAVDFDDLIMLTVQLFLEEPEVLEKYQDRWRYIMVDEYQDTNTSQYTLIKLLASKYRNLCVVGDDDQSIYQWRGADIRNILSFEEDYPEAKVVKLEENYRSTQLILDAAYDVIKHNTGRKNKKLWTQKKGGHKIVYYTALDESDEAFFITRQIRQLKEREGRSNRDFAVLCRATAQFRAVEESMIKQNIPYRIVGGTKFYVRKEIKDMIAYLSAIVNPADEINTNRCLNAPKRGLGDASWKRLLTFANEQHIPVGEALLRAEEITGLTKRFMLTMTRFGRLLEDFRVKSKEMAITPLCQWILSESGYWQELEGEDSVEAAARQENLQEFLSITSAYDLRSKVGEDNLAQFLAEVALFTDLDTYVESDDQAVIMTMHGAKGLEFPVVFMIGMEEGVFPHARSINSLEPEEMEEERRLCYVAITRAKERLFMTRTNVRLLYGRQNCNTPSRFIYEISTDNIEDLSIRVQHKSTSIAFGDHVGIRAKETPQPETILPEYVVGDKIMHKKWGEGVIVSLNNTGVDLELKVAFPEQGVKTLIAKYAPINKLS